NVVSDHTTQNPPHRRADQPTFHLVPARRRADHGTGGGADGGVTLRVLLDPRRRFRSRIVSTAAGAARPAGRGSATYRRTSVNRLPGNGLQRLRSVLVR